ncbi:hypothetical protein SNE40_001128 [Patella caerulea]|uniref:Uncharacterized protein n=1 Tax=Patella caerulea TaxID=87958 RepID=A0AAN8KGR7_PATCE
MKLKCLAILAETNVEDIKSQIDFWISDRAADCTALFHNLQIANDKILKCCAHLILCIDYAVDKTFKETELKMGFDKLIQANKILRSNSSSVHSLGLVALAKLVSPSHSSHSVSMYNEFKEWMSVNGYDSASFTGFDSNRFGRIVGLAREFLKNRDALMAFFDAVVDENSNKLVLAVHTFISNPWFICCNEVYSLIGEILIYPLMDLLGIDGRGGDRKRNWENVKEFVDAKLPELEKLRNNFANTILEEVLIALRRQLSSMDYFGSSTECSLDIDKIQRAPLTNLGCESEFAKLNNRIKIA